MADYIRTIAPQSSSIVLIKRLYGFRVYDPLYNLLRVLVLGYLLERQRTDEVRQALSLALRQVSWEPEVDLHTRPEQEAVLHEAVVLLLRH